MHEMIVFEMGSPIGRYHGTDGFVYVDFDEDTPRPTVLAAYVKAPTPKDNHEAPDSV